ncbi:MAG TPA: LLM class flavin-dependent oxidoreductase [Acetobacteraceae bacterium]|nr:LLM class flavin-dependent oxidoreductase [Acetobacteraceae bacterium]
MPPNIGYLLPTREQIMEGRPDAASLLALAARAEALGYDSVWVGEFGAGTAAARSSDAARRRGRPGSAGGARHCGAVAGTAQSRAAGAPGGDAGSGLRGALHPRRRHRPRLPNIRAEFAACGVPFEQRVGRMMEGLRLCRALWTGEAVDWDGRWPVKGGVLAPVPHRPGGPPIWIGGNTPASLERVGKWFDGWFPNAPDPAAFTEQWRHVQTIAATVGRDGSSLSAAMYLTLTVDDDADRAAARMDAFLEGYYGAPAAVLRQRQAVYSGPASGVASWLDGYARAGATDLVLRFAGEPERHLEALAKVRASLGWH